MKTAMQELIEYLRSLAFTKCHLGMGDVFLTQGHIDDLQEKFIEKEKEQIVEAHFEGWSDAYDYLKDRVIEPRQAEDYYNETYNQNNQL